MFEWVCPRCGRNIEPSLRVCPFCGGSEAAPPGAKIAEPGTPKQRRSWWSEIDRGWRWGLGFVASLALVYVVLLVVAYMRGRDDWVDRLLRLLGFG